MHVTPEMAGWSVVIALWLASFFVFLTMAVRAPMDTDIWPGGEPR